MALALHLPIVWIVTSLLGTLVALVQNISLRLNCEMSCFASADAMENLTNLGKAGSQ